MRRFLSVLLLIVTLSSCSLSCIDDTHSTTTTITNSPSLPSTPVSSATQPIFDTGVTPEADSSTYEDGQNAPPLTPHSHHFVTEQTKTPACTVAGFVSYVCECGVTQDKIIDALGHDYQLISSTPPTYVSAGHGQYKCNRCETTMQERLPPLHSTADSDMCGDSLIEKVLPNESQPTLVQKIFDIYHSHPPKYTSAEEMLLDNVTYMDIINLMYPKYTYLFDAMWLIGTTRENKPTLIIRYNEDMDSLRQKAYMRAKEIIKALDIDKTVTQKDAIIRINNWLCDNKYYNYAAVDDASLRDDSLYYSMMESPGICTNYALAFQVLCLSAGIECHYHASKTMNHAWNKVVFSDGSHLWVDVTWNDVTKLELRTKYLLIDDAMLLRDHTW